MGFSSFLDCKTKQSIPAYPYTNLPKELSHVRVIFSDDSFIEGYYDGYGNIHKDPNFVAYLSRENQEAYHESQTKRIHLWDILEQKGFLTSDNCFKDQKDHMKIVVLMNYNGEKFSELQTLESCPSQGYFYDGWQKNRLAENCLAEFYESHIKHTRTKSLKFTVFSDPSHAWIKVKRSLLTRLGIEDKISQCSYSKGDYIYLEEDADASIFIVALKSNKIPYTLVEKHTNKSSKIRSYNSYSYSK